MNDDRNAAYVLKSCLSRTPLEIVRNVDDRLVDMWARLDEKYGKASKFPDAVMNDIKRYRTIKEGDDKRFTEFVDLIERGYRDLSWLKLERELSNSTAVSIIEEKLSRDLKKAWALEISKTNSKVKDDDKFPSLLEFLNEHKRGIEYEENEIRGCSMRGEASHFELSHKSNESKSTKEQCWCVIHNNSSHNTSVCTTFSSMSPQERMKCVWDNKLCYSCLEIGHLSFACKIKTTCETEGCSRG